MNDWQALRQIQKISRALTWGASKMYFTSSNVFITTLVLENFIQVVRTSTPFQTIRLINTSPDPIHIGKGKTSIKVTNCTSVQGDSHGEMALMGINDPPATSKGRGVLLFEPGLLAAMEQLTESGGVKFSLVGQGYGDLQFVGESENISFREYDFEMESTSFKTYQEPLRFRVTGGSGSASGSWTNPSQFGFSKVTVKRGATTIVDGVATSFSDTGLSAGSYTYTIQAFYDDKSSDSSQESIILSKTVTVT